VKCYKWNTSMEVYYGAWIIKSNNHDWIINDLLTCRHNGNIFLVPPNCKYIWDIE
jgi:hypothetical protein